MHACDTKHRRKGKGGLKLNFCTKIFISLLCFPSPANDPNNFGRCFLFSCCNLICQFHSIVHQVTVVALTTLHAYAITGTTNPYCNNVNNFNQKTGVRLFIEIKIRPMNTIKQLILTIVCSNISFGSFFTGYTWHQSEN